MLNLFKIFIIVLITIAASLLLGFIGAKLGESNITHKEKYSQTFESCLGKYGNNPKQIQHCKSIIAVKRTGFPFESKTVYMSGDVDHVVYTGCTKLFVDKTWCAAHHAKTYEVSLLLINTMILSGVTIAVSSVILLVWFTKYL